MFALLLSPGTPFLGGARVCSRVAEIIRAVHLIASRTRGGYLERLLDAVERRSLEREKEEEEGGKQTRRRRIQASHPLTPPQKIETDQVDTD